MLRAMVGKREAELVRYARQCYPAAVPGFRLLDDQEIRTIARLGERHANRYPPDYRLTDTCVKIFFMEVINAASPYPAWSAEV